jgi:hypothetical protein
MLNFLLLLGDTVRICYITGAFLHGSVVEDLLSANVFLLESPQFFLLFRVRFFHFLLFDLAGSFVQNFALLLLVEAFKVVWLNSVWR